MNTINVENCKTLLIGRRGENEVTTVAFDFTEWASEFGSGVVDLYVKRFGDDSAYPIVLTIDGTVASWLVTETDTNVAGYGKAEYVYRVDGKIAKSAVFPFFVAEDIGQPASEPPDPYESWLEQLTALGAETEAHAQAAEQSAENAAESAEDAAQSATSAEGYAGQAETAAGLAQAAQTASEAARDAAQTAQASAESSATAASGSAASAASSATAAAGSASDASASASAAGASATTASTAAGQAESAKTAAQAAQSAAEDAAADAQQAAQQAHVEYEQLSGEVDDLSDEVAQQKSAIDDLSALVDRKAGMLVDSVSGAVASFTPDATIPDLLGVTVDIEPVQDLHGYDNPWPAGGGKNKLPLMGDTSLTRNGITFTLKDGVITVNGTSTAYTTFNIPLLESVDLSPSTNQIAFLNNKAADEVYVSFSRNGTRIHFWSMTPVNRVATNWTDTGNEVVDSVSVWVISGQTVNNLTLSPMLMASSVTDYTYAPYSNICPISGWDSVEVSNTSTNIWDEQWESGDYADSDGQPRVFASRIRSKNPIPCLPNTTYYFKAPERWQIFFYDAEDHFISTGTWQTNTTFTTPENCRYVRFYIVATTTYNNDISINYPSTDHAYHPYAGNRYTIQLGQTVYGGTLDVTAGTLTVDRAMVDMGTLNWSRGTFSGISYFYTDDLKTVIKRQPQYGYDNMISDIYTAVQNSGVTSLTEDYTMFVYFRNQTFYCRNDSYTDAATFKTAMSGVQLCYELAEPFEIQLDPVTISTISGQTDNVWADAGDVSVEFAADIKAYIDRMNQPTEDDMIANSLIAANKYFTINNRLFLSTASIAAGAQIIPGTNCTETSLAAALNALNA